MTPLKPKTHAHRTIRAALIGALGSALLVLAFALPASADPPEKITICHATASETNPYVSITIAPQAVVNAHIEHQHGEDIIPLFTYNDVQYSQNLDAAGLALLANDCEAPGEETSTSTTSTSSTSTPTEEVPFFTSPATLMVGVGGALAGTLLMLRRKL